MCTVKDVFIMRVKFHDQAGSSDQFNELLDKIPVRDLANRLGTDEETASEALVTALPALLARLQDNASTREGATSLLAALQDHNDDLARGSQVNLDQVDTRDGANILGHVFGNQRQEVTQQLANNTKQASPGMLESLLPMLAPIAMSFLSNNLLGSNRQNQASASQQQGGLDLGSMLGGLLGGRQAGQAQSSADGGLDVGGLLGSLFGKRS